MKNIAASIAVMLISLAAMRAQVAEMNWELDYQIYMEMANDSNYTYDISQVFHVTDARNFDFNTEFVFYPVNPGDAYGTTVKGDSLSAGNNYSTLWSALHANLGGGWVHFANCLAYAVETRTLNLEEPILKRPDTRWKPKPVTDSWKRTHRWEYYIPVSQRNAIREYKKRESENNLGDLKNLPASYIEQFLTTSNRKYRKLKEEDKYTEKAQIDLVKIILGANYLGEPQINYISNAVLTAVKSYSATKLPSVIVFDEFDAAAAMTLNADGYQIESVVFKESANLSEEMIQQRREEITQIIDTINAYNKEAFRKRLGSYYKN